MLSVRVLVFGPDAQADPANKNIAAKTVVPNRNIPISPSRDFPRPIQPPSIVATRRLSVKQPLIPSAR
jgi:hypothetical protein